MKFNKISFSLLLVLSIALGVCVDEVYRGFNYQRSYDGLMLSNIDGHSNVLAEANKYDEGGDWVCVNIGGGMSFEDAVETCNHEVGHEIFAEYCEKNNNIERCINITQ